MIDTLPDLYCKHMHESMRNLSTEYLSTVMKRCMTPSAYKDAILRLKITIVKEFKHSSLL